MRQFINNDNSTVCIVSFGLRGSVMLNAAATVINSAHDIVKACIHAYFDGLQRSSVILVIIRITFVSNKLGEILVVNCVC